MNEAARQQALLQALHENPRADDRRRITALDLRERGARAARGLDAYRANADALADRALATVFGTVRAMVGDSDFSLLAREFWGAHRPQRGDMGEWGDALPAWLETHPRLTAWPWLGDCARLDLARHRNERAADAVLDAASLAQLESADPDRLRLVLMPGTELLCSRWPIATIDRAHAVEGDAAEPAFAAVREALAAQRAEQVLVARRGWRAHVYAVDADTARWTQHLLAGATLGQALEACGGAFDFSAWLATALREGWLKGVVAASD